VISTDPPAGGFACLPAQLRSCRSSERAAAAGVGLLREVIDRCLTVAPARLIRIAFPEGRGRFSGRQPKQQEPHGMPGKKPPGAVPISNLGTTQARLYVSWLTPWYHFVFTFRCVLLKALKLLYFLFSAARPSPCCRLMTRPH
jgi:hypothetical protein